MSPLLGTGTISHCILSGACRRVASNLKFPNGLVIGKDKRLYVPSSATGKISVYDIADDYDLTLADTIDTELPLDNLSVDSEGAIWAAAFPKGLETIKAFTAQDTWTVWQPSTTGLRITRKDDGSGWRVDKVIEDNGSVLPGMTSIVHDVETGRLFMSGVAAPFIAVCEPLGYKMAAD